MQQPMTTNNEVGRIKKAERVTLVGFVVNMILSVAKIVAGVVGHSSAMLADGIHSLSDFITDLIVIVFIRVSGRQADSTHAYGHGKFETFATLLIAVVLFAVGVGLCIDAVETIAEAYNGNILKQPSMIALWAALTSIATKEILYHYTARSGRRIGSSVVIANAWHHRSDAFSSIGTAVGIGGAIFLGEQWRILDPIASMIVSAFIIKMAIELAKPCIEELLEVSLPEEMRDKIVSIILQHPEVVSYHKLKTRRIGNSVAIDVHIQLDKNLSFEASHEVTRDLESSLKDVFGDNTHVSIHAEPV